MKLTKKRKKKIKNFLGHVGLVVAILLLIGLFVFIGYSIPLMIRERNIERAVEDSSLFTDYQIQTGVVTQIGKAHDDKAYVYVCEGCRWRWNEPTAEYMAYLEKVNDKWVVKEKKFIWRN